MPRDGLVDAAAIVFDAVGTLICPDPAVATIYAAVAQRHGSKWTETEVATRFRSVFTDVESQAAPETDDSIERRRWQEIVGRVLDDVGDPAAVFQELFDHFARPDSWAVFPDVAPAFERLQDKKVQLALASNFDERLIAIADRVTPLNRCHPVIVSSRVGYRKPHPRFFQAVVQALDVEPSQILFVGDDPHYDVAGARAVGMHAVLLARDGKRGPGAINSLTELSI